MRDLGQMRNRITLQTEGTTTKDSYGGRTTPWIDVTEVYAELNPYRLREQITLRRRNGEDVVGLRIRAPQPAAALHKRVLVEGVGYRIVEIDRSRVFAGELMLVAIAEVGA